MADVRFIDATRVLRGLWRPALDGVDLDVRDGEFLVVTGPSGSGKTTLLRMLAGLEPVDRGRLLVGGADVTGMSADRRGVSLVFQGFALFPHLSVYENIALPLTLRRVSVKTARAQVAQAARICGLTGDQLAARPDALTFEARQRTTLARAIVRRPKVVCLDEPPARNGAGDIRALQRELGVTMLYATSAPSDSWAGADRIAILDGGVLQQVGTPQEVHERPATVSVAGLLGTVPMNLVETVVVGGRAVVGDLDLPVRDVQVKALTGPRVVVGLDPRGLVIGREGGGVRAIAARVKDIGRYHLVRAMTQVCGQAVALDVLHAGGAPPVPGERLVISAGPAAFHLFDAQTGLRLPD